MATGLERTNSKSVECLQRGLFDVDGEETVFATNGNKAAAKRRHVKQSEASPSADAEERLLEALNSVSARLDSRIAIIESAVLKLREELIAARTVKEFYTTAEVAGILGKRPYTVREWCRLGRVNGQKAPSGRGLDEEWRVSHEELIRIQNEGLLEPKSEAQVMSAGRIARPR